jgi:hypothetical protein
MSLSHGLMHQLLSLAPGLARGDYAGQVGGVRRIAGFVVAFENDDVAFHCRSFLKPACFRNARFCLRLQRSARLAGDRYKAGLLGVDEMALVSVTRLSVHPSASSNRIVSLIFIGTRGTVPSKLLDDAGPRLASRSVGDQPGDHTSCMRLNITPKSECVRHTYNAP